MAQQQQQAQQYWSPSHLAVPSRHRPGTLLLGDIQTLQQQQQQQQLGAGFCQSAGGRSSPRIAFNEVSALALSADPNSSSTSSGSADTDFLHSQQFPDPELAATALSSEQQQPQQGPPFWKGPQQQQRAASPVSCQDQQHLHRQQQQSQPLRYPSEPQQAAQQHQHQQQQHKPLSFRQGSVGPQFASATLSGSSNSSGSDSPSALKAVGRVFGNGEICKLLGFISAQLLMHFATIQHGMHQLHQRQQGLSGGSDQQQQQQQHGPFGGWRPRMPWQRQEGGVGSGEGGASNGSNSGKAGAWQAGEAAKQWVTRGIKAERDIQLREALACYTNAVTLEPGNREYLCRLAKQWSDLTYEEGATVEQIQEVNSKAVEYADRVIAMAPKAADGYMAACVSKGRLALFSDNKTKVRLAKEAQEAARTAVDLDPSNDLAHHLMGRWHFEMAQINFVLRQLIRIVYGAALNPGTFDDALTEFQQAVAINPYKLIHRVELGRTHLRLGHKRDAYHHLLASMDLEIEDINAKLQREDAELLLAKLQSELKGRKELPASWGGFTAPGIQPSDAAAAAGTGSSVGSSAGSVVSSSASSSSSCVIEEVIDDDISSGRSSSGGSVAGGAGMA